MWGLCSDPQALFEAEQKGQGRSLNIIRSLKPFVTKCDGFMKRFTQKTKKKESNLMSSIVPVDGVTTLPANYSAGTN